MNRITLTIPLRPECIVAARLGAGSVAKILKLGVDDAEDLKLVTNEGCGILFAQNFESCEVSFDWTDGVEITFTGVPGQEAPECREEEVAIGLMLLEGLSDSVTAERTEVIRKICVKKSYR